jgi:hypothetical protein
LARVKVYPAKGFAQTPKVYSVRRGSPDPAEGATEGLPNVAAAHKRAEYPSALRETFGQRPWPGQETGHNGTPVEAGTPTLTRFSYRRYIPAEFAHRPPAWKGGLPSRRLPRAISVARDARGW